MFQYLLLIIPRQRSSTAWGDDGRTASLQINHSFGTAALGKGCRKLRKVRLRICCWVQGLYDNVQVTSARQAQLFGFFGGIPY